MVVDVNKIRCNFVNEVIKYIACGKYSIDCCSTKALKAWMDYKLAVFTDCDIPVDTTCYLSELDLTDYVLDCGATSLLDCDSQITLNLTKLIQSCLITSVLSNPDDGSQYPKITIGNDSSFWGATINVLTTSSCGGTNTTAIASGCQPDINGDLVCADEFDPHARIVLTIPSNYVQDSTLTRLWVYRTINPYVLSFPIELDLSVATSPYLVCAGCVTVDPLELKFSHPNFTIAATDLIRNAILTVFGDADLGDFTVTRSVFGNPIEISSLVRHNPTAAWIGLGKFKSKAEWIWDGIDQKLQTGPGDAGLRLYSEFMQVNYNVPLLDCTTAVLTVQGMVTMNVNEGASDMHQLILNSPNSSTPLSINSVSNWICPKITLTATVTAQDTIASQEWLNPASAFITAALSTVVEDPGIYTFNIELDNGCSTSDTITV